MIYKPTGSTYKPTGSIYKPTGSTYKLTQQFVYIHHQQVIHINQ